MTRRRRKLLVALGAALIIAGFSSPAAAVDQGSLGTAGPKKRVIEHNGLPIPGIYPGEGLPQQPLALFRPTACRTIIYCDTFEFDVDYPPELLGDVLFAVSVTLTWENPKTTSNPNGNDLDLFLWPDDDPALGGPISRCGTPSTDACDNLSSETVTIAEPDNTLNPDDDFTPYLFTIVNHSGLNVGYKLTIRWFTFELPPPPEFEPPEIETSTGSDPNITGPFDFAVTGSQDDEPETPRKILIPGPDGALREVELPFFAAGQQAVASRDRGVSPWITASIVGAVVMIGFSWLLIVRSRRRDEIEY